MAFNWNLGPADETDSVPETPGHAKATHDEGPSAFEVLGFGSDAERSEPIVRDAAPTGRRSLQAAEPVVADLVFTAEPANAPAVTPVDPAISTSFSFFDEQPAATVAVAPEAAPEQATSRRALRARETDPALALPVPVAPAASEFVPLVASTDAISRGRRAAVASKATRRPAGRTGATTGPAKKPAVAKSRRGLFSKLLTIGAMLGAGALVVSTSLPANAFYNPADAASVVTSLGPAQKLVVTQNVVAASATRDNYTVASLQELLMLKYGSRAYSYTTNPLGAIQWPFPIPVPIASGFGDRQVANCSFCSTFHEGLDFTPGAGVAIGAVTAGTVTKVEYDRGGLGNNVTIDHGMINGHHVETVYGHMLNDSVRVVVGQKVKVADEVGQVGSTGASTGAHLHLEVHLDGVPVDPFVWLKANAV